MRYGWSEGVYMGLVEIPAPGSVSRAEELIACQAALMRLSVLAIKAAEMKYPGIEKHIGDLISRVASLEQRGGEA